MVIKLRTVGKYLLVLLISSAITALTALSSNKFVAAFAILFVILSAFIFALGLVIALFALFDWILE